MPLKKYHAKRVFKKTPEPKGTLRKKIAGKLPHFVVQKHAASHLHYDFRLEMNGVLKSWAVPKGLPLKTNEKHLAIEVEDHPYEYKDFEGIIPKGNYGAGKVIIWDEGDYEPLDDKVADPNRYFTKSLANGHIVFILHGKKLSGEFALIKIKGNGKKNSWLIIKTKNNSATKKSLVDEQSVRSGLTLEQLHQGNFDLTKTPKAAMPKSVSPMLSTAVTQPFNHPEWLFEIKWDGYRIIAFVSGRRIKLETRNHQDYTDFFGPIATALAQLDLKAVFDGEMVVVDDHGRSNFQLMQQYQSEGIGQLIYYVFDLIWLDGHDLRHVPLTQRKQLLLDILPSNNQVKFSEHVENEGKKFFKAAKEHQLEGIMAKEAAGFYREGKRTHSWLKIKSRPQQEAVICGYTAPRGQRKLIGALILGVYERGNLQYIGHTGTGFNEQIIKDLKPRLDRLAQPDSPFNVAPKTNAAVTWVKPQLVCEVAFHEWTEKGILRQPSFLGLRIDKLARSVGREPSISTEQIAPQKEAAKPHPAAKHPAKSDSTAQLPPHEEVIVTVNRQHLKLSNLDKVLWPESGYTKRDLIDYYLHIAKFILPYLKNYPQVLHRYPNGILGESFYQKNNLHVPSWLTTLPIHSEGENRDVNYLICENAATLIYMANLGCIDMNPWLSRRDSLEKPDYCVLDLDPYEIEFDAVIETAIAIHKFLDQLEVKHFCKTSGATGLHIYIPFKSRYTFEQSKQFAQLILSHIHQQLPKTTSMERRPEKRKGAVYLDYLQNRIGQTIAAPYSIRPRAGAPVSTPLHWTEVNKKLSPLQFTIATIGKRLEKEGDIWRFILRQGVNLEKILKKMV